MVPRPRRFTTLVFLIPILVFVAAAPVGAYKIPALVLGPKDADVDGLRACLTSAGIPADRIVLRDDPSTHPVYEDLNWQWNKLKGQIEPAVYLVAETDADVSIAVRCSAQTGIRIVARSGGHSYVKHGYGDENSFIVDLQRMNSVSVRDDPETGSPVATVGAGIRGGKLKADLWAAGGLFTSTGLCPTVGVTGYTLGGGYGYFSRLLGLGLDNLLEVSMVEASGALLTVNNETFPDLFWALRGGGGGNFGILTSMKLKGHPAPRWLAFAVLQFDFLQDFPAFFKSWQSFITTNPPPPDHVTTFIRAGLGAIEIDICSMRYEDDAGESALAEVQQIIADYFPPPRSVSINVLTYPEFMLARAQVYSDEQLTSPDQLANLTRHNMINWKKVKSVFVDRVLASDEEILEFRDLLLGHFQGSPGSGIGFEHYGGSINRVGRAETAYVHRGATLYEMQIAVTMPDAEGTEPGVEAMERFFEESKRVLQHTESYQNYLDEDLPDFLRRYYGDNLERLVAVKRTFDPNNLFNNPLSIPVRL